MENTTNCGPDENQVARDQRGLTPDRLYSPIRLEATHLSLGSHRETMAESAENWNRNRPTSHTQKGSAKDSTRRTVLLGQEGRGSCQAWETGGLGFCCHVGTGMRPQGHEKK